MMRNTLVRIGQLATFAVLVAALTNTSFGVLYLYEPFNYDPGETLGGSDPDGEGPDPFEPIGQTNLSAGGGTWYSYAQGGMGGNYAPSKDAAISTGNLSYTGLATSQGNSVSYGSAGQDNTLFGDAIPLPTPVTSGALYASFIIRIKSPFDTSISSSAAIRHSPAAFLQDKVNADGSDGAVAAGGELSIQNLFGATVPGGFWMRRDPVNADITNFSPGKSGTDGIGPGEDGPSAGWQHSNVASTESNQFGAVTGQASPVFANPNTWQTYFVVLKYNFTDNNPNNDNDGVSLWMNPGVGTLGSATGEEDASQALTGNLGSYYGTRNALGTATSDSSVISSFALIGHRQDTIRTLAIDFDELRIGTTWADVTPAALAGVQGDYNGNGIVDGADYVVWRKNKGLTGSPTAAQGNGDGDGDVDDADYDYWRARFGNTGSGLGGASAVPEPATLVMFIMAVVGIRLQHRHIAWRVPPTH